MTFSPIFKYSTPPYMTENHILILLVKTNPRKSLENWMKIYSSVLHDTGYYF